MAAAATAIVAASVMTAGFLFRSNHVLRTGLDTEKLKSESLLSEKLQLDKELDQFRTNMVSMQGKNDDLDKLLKDANLDLSQKQAEINKLLGQQTDNIKLRNELSDLRTLKAQYETQIAVMQATIDKLNQDIRDLLLGNENLNSTITFLRTQNQSLSAQLQLLRDNTSDNYAASAFRGNKDKLTVNAKRTRKIDVHFDMPSTAGNNLQFTITTPSGRILNSKADAGFSSNIVNQEELVAGETGVKHVEMLYETQSKLESGTYKIDIYTEGNYLGSCNVQLK